MSALEIVLASTVVIAGSGFLALLLARATRLAKLVAVSGAVAGGAVGTWGALAALGSGWTGELATGWSVPAGAFVVGLDSLSAFFLVPVFALGALCAVYGHEYMGPRAVAAAKLNLLLAAMALILIARHGLLFLVAWEAMTVLAYLLVTTHDEQDEVRRAGWVYLIASHVAVLALLSLFLVLGEESGGDLRFTAIAGAPRAGSLGILSLALIGFGIKAGAAGLHVWLPEAHAAAPAHISALMSGVLVKLGVYGLLRTALLVGAGRSFGAWLMLLGSAGALLGIALAVYQRDLKRVLAYSSVENVGIILLALGLGFWARASGEPGLAALAFGAGLLHVWNHAAMKGLLFLSAGSVLHATGTKDIEQLGGLLKAMPWTGRAMIVGAVAIAALPPLNGLPGEWLLYVALTRVAMEGAALESLAAIAVAAAVALVGGLAALCFVRLIGMVLLGTPRTEAAARAHESPAAITIPLTCLAAACLAAALGAPALVSLQAPLLTELCGAGAADIAAAASLLRPMVLADCGLLALIGLVTLLLARRVRRAGRTETWGCGYVSPTARMQYTGRAFSELVTARAMPRWLQPRLRVRLPQGCFPVPSEFSSEAIDPLTRDAYEPFLDRWGGRFARLRFLQQGNIHIYILYIFAVAIIGLAWVAARDWLVA